MSDTRIVYGVRCFWWDSINNIGRIKMASGHGVPCCPHCGSVLFELPDEASWWKGVDRFEDDGHPGYRKLLEWCRGKCFKTRQDAEAAFAAEPPTRTLQ